MSDEDVKQPVSDEPDAQAAQPETEEVNTAPDESGNDYEEALNEFRQEVQPEPPQYQPQMQPQDQPEMSPEDTRWIEDLQRTAEMAKYHTDQIAEERAQKALDSAIKTVRGDLGEEIFPDEMVQAFLQGKANQNPAVYEAWLRRDQKPDAYNRVLKGLGKEFYKNYGKFSGIDQDATDTRDVVTAAVKGTSGKAPAGEKPKYGDMSNNAFAKNVKDEFGFDPF